QIGLALHLYHDANGRFPVGLGFNQQERNCPAGTTGRHFWTYNVLDYLEQRAVAELINPSQWAAMAAPGVDANTQQAFQTTLKLFQCPSDITHVPDFLTSPWVWSNFTRSNYAGCFSPHGFVIEPEACVPCLVNHTMNGGQQTTANPTV